MARHRLQHKGNWAGWFPSFVRQELPGYGSAQQYSFETLSLTPHALANGFGVPVATPVFGPPSIEHVQLVRMDGYGLEAGTIALPSLFNPAANLTPLK